MTRYLLTLSLVVAVGAVTPVARPDQAKDQPKEQSKSTRGIVKVGEEAKRIHSEAIVVDGHNDLPWRVRGMSRGSMSFSDVDISRPQPKMHTDIPRLRAGNVGAQFWSVYVPSNTMDDRTAVTKTLEQIDVVHRMIRRYPETFAFAGSVDDILRARKEGKIASMIGIEGGHSIDNSLGVLRMMYAVGVRYMTLTHSKSLDWADSCTDDPKAHGLSKFGENVVQEMNRLGMFVDISHVSPETMKAALKVSRAPVIASHSSARGLADHPRNVPDDVLKLVKENRGVIMVNYSPGFILPEAARVRRDEGRVANELRQKYPNDADFQAALAQWQREHPIPKCSVHTLVDHIEHIIKMAGIDNVGLGSDYDGIGSLPEQLEDVSTYPVITQVLLDRGYKKEEIIKVLGGNLIRAFREMEGVSQNMTK